MTRGPISKISMTSNWYYLISFLRVYYNIRYMYRVWIEHDADKSEIFYLDMKAEVGL